MIKKVCIVAMWFPLIILLLINCVHLLKAKNIHNVIISSPISYTTPVGESEILSSNQSGTGQVLSAHIIAADGRIELLKRFMEGSPLEPYANQIVRNADIYSVDFRFVPSIAMCESNLGKRIPSSDSYNAWGIAVYTGQTSGRIFEGGWPQAIDWVYQFIDGKFLRKGITDVTEIGAIWAPPSKENGNSWANCVTSFMEKIQ